MQSPLHELAPLLTGQSLRVLIWDHDLIDMWCLDDAGRRLPYIGKGSTWHYHADLEFTVITSGEGLLCVGDHIGRFQAPDCLLLGSDVPHVWKAEGALSGISLQFSHHPSSGLGTVPELRYGSELWSRSRHGLRWDPGTAREVSGLIAQMADVPALRRLGIFLRIVEILQLTHRTHAQQLSGNVLTRPLPGDESLAMDRVFDHIMNHFRDDVSLDALVHMSGCSQATFCRRFQKHSGKTFVAYLNAIRLQDVRWALVNSERSVTDIAFGAGFNNLSHFHAVFRREAGCTPRTYRQRYRVTS